MNNKAISCTICNRWDKKISVSPFFSGGKSIERNKYEEEYHYNEIEEKFHIETRKTDKSQSATNKETNKARINTSSVFQWNTSSLHNDKDSRISHLKNWKKNKKWEILLTVPMHQKWLASHGTSLLNLLILMGWRTLHLQVLSISAQSWSNKLFIFFRLDKLLWRLFC